MKSYISLISSMLIFGTIGIFRRYVPLSSGLLACTRGFLGSMVLVLFVLLKGKSIRHNIGIKKTMLLALTGALIGFNWIFLFEAYNYATVATATLCYYMQPTIVILLSPIFFKEKITLKKGLCVLFSIIGMALVSGVFDQASGNTSDIRGIILGLMAAALYATVIILNKKVQIEDAYEKTIIQLFSAALILVPYLLITEDFSAIEFSTISVIMIFVIGIVHTGFAYALYFSSMNNLNAQSIALLSYIDPVSALILSALILKEPLSLYGIIGAVLIIGAALLSELNIKLKSN